MAAVTFTFSDVPRYNASEQSIPLRDLTLLDLKGNPVEKVTMGYLKKDGEPVRLSENMVNNSL